MQQEQHAINEIHKVKWKSLLLMLLGWALSWGFGWEIGLQIDSVIRNLLNNPYGFLFEDPFSIFYRLTIILGLIIGGLIGGASAGTSIAWVLRKENVIKNKQSYVLIVLGWGIAGAICLSSSRTMYIVIGFIVSGLIGGGFLAWALWKEKVLNTKLSIILIPLGWSVSLIAGLASFSIHWIIYLVLGWLVGGAIFTWMLSPQVESENRKHIIIQIIRGWLVGGISSFAVWVLGYALILPISGPGDSPVLGMFLMLFIVSGLIVGFVVGVAITFRVLSKEKPITYIQIFPRIGLGLLIIGLIIGMVVWGMSNINIAGLNFARLFNFAINNVISGVIGWGIMIWVLRKNTIQK